MSASSNRISELIFKKLQEDLSPAEIQELEQFTNSSSENKTLVEDLTNPEVLANIIAFMERVNIDDDRKELGKMITREKKVRRKRRIRSRRNKR